MNYATLEEFLQDLPGLAREHRQALAGRSALFRLETRQGRCVLLRLADGEATLPAECAEEPACTLIADEGDLLALIAGKLSPARALMLGKVKIKGNPKPLLDLVALLK